jgi:hypothetical protein
LGPEIVSSSSDLRARRQLDGRQQGYRIGRIFAHWAIVYFGQFFLKIAAEMAQILDYFFN